MKDAWPYLSVFVAAFIVGMLVMKQCSTPETVQLPGEVHRDTVQGKADTVVLKQTRTVYEPQYVYMPDSSKDCMEQLAKCADAYEQQSFDFWKLANLELEATKALPWGDVKAWLYMPRYVNNPDNPESAFEFEATYEHQDSTVIVTELRERRRYERFGAGIHVTAGVDPFRKDWSVTAGVGVHYSLTGR